jgi:hypothetical protein
VVESSWKPAVGGVTCTTSISKLTFVSIILGVAGITVLGGCLQVGDAASAGMARTTVHLDVLPSQLEGDIIMVEIVIVSIDPIMASQAVPSISLEVRLHEIGLDLLVTGGANGLVKRCIAIDMASVASKRRTIRLALVGGEIIPESIV